MRQVFLAAVQEGGEMTDEWYFNNSFGANDAWNLIDSAIFRLENAGEIVDQCGAQELYKQWQEYPQMSQDFKAVMETVRDYFINE